MAGQGPDHKGPGPPVGLRPGCLHRAKRVCQSAAIVFWRQAILFLRELAAYQYLFPSSLPRFLKAQAAQLDIACT